MGYSIGVDIGGTNIKIGLVDERGKVVRRGHIPNDPRVPPEALLARLAAAVMKIASGRDVRALGVGVAGLVDSSSGRVVFSPNLPLWQGVGVKETLARLTGFQVACTNDANAVTIGEWRFGAARGYQNVLCVTLGTGVGAGIIIDNKPVFGANGFAAELGHTAIGLHGPACACGGQGCLESYVGARALVRRARRLLRAHRKSFSVRRNQLALFQAEPSGISKIFELTGYDLRRLTPKEIGAAARRGDRIALRVVEELGYFLGLGVYNAVLLLDPEVVVIGGGVSRIGAPLLKAVQRTVFSRPYLGQRKLMIVLSRLREDAGILGASLLGEVLG